MNLHAGIDVGSVNTKLVLWDAGAGRICCDRVEPTGPRPKETARRLLEQCLAAAGVGRDELARVVATGYARHSVEGTNAAITEIKAAATGIRFWHPGAHSIIDIGGQDSKALALDVQGRVRDFVMNDRCAAGTGHFLSVMARTLGVELGAFGPLALTSQRPVPISSLCVVMAESEILSLLAAETPVEDIIAGLHQALARRVANMAARLQLEPEVVFTGGVAQDEGMRQALEAALGLPVRVAERPLLAAALGAALTSAT